jgi:hypothetical protein
MAFPGSIADALAGLIVFFGLIYGLKEFFDLYFERQEMKARLDLMRKIEAHTLINEAKEESKQK